MPRSEIVWDDPPSAFARSVSYGGPVATVSEPQRACPPKLPKHAKAGPQADKFAGGHRIRVTPVPIPNTEVKPDTADGTAWETVWESRSLPALSINRFDIVVHENDDVGPFSF